MRKVFSHGEVSIFSGASIPEGAKKLEAVNGAWKVADSESTGNHHMIEAKEGVEMFEKDGTLFLKASEPTSVFCVQKERHDSIELDKGIYEITPAQEYDYLNEEIRNVAD